MTIAMTTTPMKTTTETAGPDETADDDHDNSGPGGDEDDDDSGHDGDDDNSGPGGGGDDDHSGPGRRRR